MTLLAIALLSPVAALSLAAYLDGRRRERVFRAREKAKRANMGPDLVRWYQ